MPILRLSGPLAMPTTSFAVLSAMFFVDRRPSGERYHAAARAGDAARNREPRLNRNCPTNPATGIGSIRLRHRGRTCDFRPGPKSLAVLKPLRRGRQPAIAELKPRRFASFRAGRSNKAVGSGGPSLGVSWIGSYVPGTPRPYNVNTVPAAILPVEILRVNVVIADVLFHFHSRMLRKKLFESSY